MMGQTRYCSTCGALLSEGAVICGECGARYQASPYERRATDAPGAWSNAPAPRSRDLGREESTTSEDEGVELITRESLEPKNPSATTLRSREQYDQMMGNQPPMHQNGPGSAPGAPSGPGSPAVAPGAPTAGLPMEPPLDGCVPATAGKRLIAAIIDSVIANLVLLPLYVGAILAITSQEVGTLPVILIGVGVALPLAYALLIIWLVGSKGFSIGKLILGMRVTRSSEGGTLGFLRSAGRWVLYGLIPLIMALSIFLDPKKQLRGFHDRVADSVVVDVKGGRDPMKARPDDFERAGAEHYLGAPSVAVSTHENLLTEPGAAWKDSSAPAPVQPTTDGAWDSAAAPSPYAPPASGPSAAEAPAQQPSAGGWAPPPIEPVPSQEHSWGQPSSAPEAPQQSWGQPQSAPEPSQPAWGQPDARGPAPSQPWDRPESAPEAPQSDVAQGWAPPPAPSDVAESAPPPYGQPPFTSDPHGVPAADTDAAVGGGAAWTPGGGDQWSQGVPNDLTGDAWDAENHGVDEQTRLTTGDDPLGDLEQTRISAVQLPAVKKVRLTTDDGTERLVEKAVVIGRNPSAPGEEVLFVMKDDTRSVSKTHLRIDGTGDDVTVTDLGSTNGSSILREDGSRENLVPNSPTVLPTGAQLTLGDRTVSVERVQ